MAVANSVPRAARPRVLPPWSSRSRGRAIGRRTSLIPGISFLHRVVPGAPSGIAAGGPPSAVHHIDTMTSMMW